MRKVFANRSTTFAGKPHGCGSAAAIFFQFHFASDLIYSHVLTGMQALEHAKGPNTVSEAMGHKGQLQTILVLEQSKMHLEVQLFCKPLQESQ